MRLLAAAEDARAELEATRVEMVRALAESRGCRWRFVLTYLGQTDVVDCGRCDRCTARPADEAGPAPASGPFPPGSRVAHTEWGPGDVVGVEGDTVTVLFESHGYRTLALELVLERHLLRLVEPEGAAATGR